MSKPKPSPREETRHGVLRYRDEYDLSGWELVKSYGGHPVTPLSEVFNRFGGKEVVVVIKEVWNPEIHFDPKRDHLRLITCNACGGEATQFMITSTMSEVLCNGCEKPPSACTCKPVWKKEAVTSE